MWQSNPQYTLIRKENSFMADEKEVQEEKPGPQKVLSAEEVMNSYPVDRDKARDAVLIEISKSLIRIASSMDAIPHVLLQISDKIKGNEKV